MVVAGFVLCNGHWPNVLCNTSLLGIRCLYSGVF
jgi:hypothetical protein